MNEHQKQVVSWYLDYANNFITVTGFAEYYGFSRSFANEIINEGRNLLVEFNNETV